MLATGIGRPRSAIMKTLAAYYYLTAEQITRLLFSPASYAYVNNTHLKFLADSGLVERILPAKQLLYGKPPYVYTLSGKGRQLAKQLGEPVQGRNRSILESTHKPYTLSHMLAVNEFLIKTTLLAKHQEDMVLRQTVHDKVLARNPLSVTLPTQTGGRETKNLIPDSWIDLGQKSLRRRYCFCVEVNLTELTQRRWRETIRKYLYCLPAYKEHFGTGIITVLVSIQTPTDFPIKPLDKLTPAEWEQRHLEEQRRRHRRQNLLQWTETEVQAQNLLSAADMFRFSSAPLDQLSSEELYFGQHWYSPFSDSPVSLLVSEDREAAG